MPVRNKNNSHDFAFLRKHGLLVGACLCVYLLLQNLLVYALLLFGLYEDYLENAALQNGVSIAFVTFGCLGVPFILLSLRKGTPSYHKVLPFNAPEDKSKALYLICIGFAVCLASNYCASWFEMIAGGFGFEIEGVETAETQSFGDSALSMLAAAFAAPLVEEFVFRGVIMQPLRRYGDRFAVVASAFIFSLCHGSPTSIVFAFISGLALGYAAVASKSLWTGIIIHFLNNFFAVAMYEIYKFFPDLSDVPYLFALTVVFAAGIASVAALAVRGELRLSKTVCELSVGEKLRAFFLNIPMLIAVVILVVGMLSYVSSGGAE